MPCLEPDFTVAAEEIPEITADELNAVFERELGLLTNLNRSMCESPVGDTAYFPLTSFSQLQIRALPSFPASRTNAKRATMTTPRVARRWRLLRCSPSRRTPSSVELLTRWRGAMRAVLRLLLSRRKRASLPRPPRRGVPSVRRRSSTGFCTRHIGGSAMEAFARSWPMGKSPTLVQLMQSALSVNAHIIRTLQLIRMVDQFDLSKPHEFEAAVIMLSHVYRAALRRYRALAPKVISLKKHMIGTASTSSLPHASHTASTSPDLANSATPGQSSSAGSSKSAIASDGDPRVNFAAKDLAMALCTLVTDVARDKALHWYDPLGMTPADFVNPAEGESIGDEDGISADRLSEMWRARLSELEEESRESCTGSVTDHSNDAQDMESLGTSTLSGGSEPRAQTPVHDDISCFVNTHSEVKGKVSNRRFWQWPS